MNLAASMGPGERKQVGRIDTRAYLPFVTGKHNNARQSPKHRIPFHPVHGGGGSSFERDEISMLLVLRAMLTPLLMFLCGI